MPRVDVTAVLWFAVGTPLLFGPTPAFALQEDSPAEQAKEKTPAASKPAESSPAPAAKENDAAAAKDAPKDAPKDASADSKDAAAAPAIVKRPAAPEGAAAIVEGGADLFDADADGNYSFNFRGAPWPAVVTALADASGLSLDWQELPGDTLNLRTQRAYTAEEARDLINRHLLARGFTLLVDGEVLTVANLKKLDPGAVPAVTPEELADLPPNRFVKCVFALDWLPAERAAEELKVLLSPRGTLAALPGSNRVLAMDAAGNLQQLAAILREEQQGRGKERLVRQFRLEHIRADRAKQLLDEFLGLVKEDDSLPSNPQLAQMEMQMRMQQAQMAKNQPGGGADGKAAGTIRLIVNERENAILAQAPPEQMAILESSVEALDVPRDPTDGLLARMVMREDPVRIYRLARLNPEMVVRLLSNSGELGPLTRVEVDEKANALVVNGSPTDHLIVARLVESLDGTDRSFEVLPLRRLPADYVAGTVRFMMGVEEEKPDDDGNSRYGFFSYGYGSSSTEEEEEGPEGQFRVDADVRNNRLLLWANPVELSEVNALLVKLGEVRASGVNRSATRVLDVTADQSEEILERLRTAWPHVRDNPLDLPAAPPAAPTGAGPSDAPPGEGPEARIDAPGEESNVAARSPISARPAALRQAADTPSPPPLTPERITVRRTPDGRLVLESDDLDALDALEDLVGDLTPPQREFHVFQLEHVQSAEWLTYQLEDFFEADADAEETRDWWGQPINVKSEAPGRLSDRKPLRFIGDSDTRTILVQNATPAQLRQIGDLLKIWDQSPEQRGGSLRLTQYFNLKSAKAEQVAATIKDVYRDLLSTDDPARQKGDEKEKQPAAPAYTYVYGRQNEDDRGGDEEPPIRFKGLLSVGVHEESNTLVISASEGLMTNVAALVEVLEENARQATAASMMWQGGPRAVDEMKTRLQNVLGDSVTISPARVPASAEVGAARTLGDPPDAE
ncbi:secretin N-terminal domain-containing protein [Alienimonas californiensis]|uniref:Bacterial type II/III secretion system short domain protein n=1 Tax=Alienimonas californiensis TaxID=2527989 RepID=A0A517PDG5_9PLAN|nr:secretin N-terminal domain-containing protein [Alienimonas californiensis]QDT17424.1 Bacterial type II/III secretion system short domain protein [Alienimonas californiensis]